MVGAGLILILAGLVAPIALIVLAVVFDLALLAWMAFHTILDRLTPIVAAVALPGRRQVHVHP